MGTPLKSNGVIRIEKAKARMKSPYDWSLEKFYSIDDQIWDLREAVGWQETGP